MPEPAGTIIVRANFDAKKQEKTKMDLFLGCDGPMYSNHHAVLPNFIRQ